MGFGPAARPPGRIITQNLEMKISDSIFGAVFVTFALLIFWSASSLPNIPGQDVGPWAFPGVLAILLAGCGGLLVLHGYKERAVQGWISFDPWTRSWPHLRNFLTLIAGLLFYILYSEELGFHLCAIVILTALLLSLQITLPRALAVAVGATLAVHLIFYKGLKVPLPWGLLPVLW
jgi:putative tricarboxylic transport membrane protein